MPVLIVLFLVWLFIPQRTRTAPKPKRIAYTQPRPLPVYDPIKAQREADRRADRARRIAEREARQAAEAAANECKANQNMMLCEQYSKYLQSLKEEYNDPSISLTRQNQVHKEILRAQEKIIRYMNEADKARYSAKAYQEL